MNQLKSKKKILTCGVALAITASALTGCGEEDFSYKTVTGGAIEIDGTIPYNVLANAQVIKIKNEKTNQEKFFLCKKVHQDQSALRLILVIIVILKVIKLLFLLVMMNYPLILISLINNMEV